MTNGLADTKTLLRQIEAAEQAEAAATESEAREAAALAREADSRARKAAVDAEIARREAHLKALAEDIGPAERKAEEEAIALRAEVQDLKQEREGQQQVLWNTRRQIERESEDLKTAREYRAALGVGGWQQREAELKAFYERRIDLLTVELAHVRGEKVATTMTTPPATAPDDGATDAELLEQYLQTPEGQLWTQEGASDDA